MSAVVTLNITGMAAAMEYVRQYDRSLSGAAEHALRPAVTGVVVQRYEQLGQKVNRLGGQRTYFWQQAASATTSAVKGTTVTVTTAHRGVALHLYGGTVKPKGTSEITGKPIRFLTIPAIAAAHGKTAATLRAMGVTLYAARGGLREQLGAQRNAQTDPLWFRFARSVTIKPNPAVLPSNDEIAEAAWHGLGEFFSAIQKGGTATR